MGISTAKGCVIVKEVTLRATHNSKIWIGFNLRDFVIKPKGRGTS